MSDLPQNPIIHAFFDEPTYTVSYLVADPLTREAAVIDPVLDYDANSGAVGTRSADAILAKAAEEGIRIVWILETHAHADHLSASAYIKRKTGARVGIGEHIRTVQQVFAPVFNATDLVADGSNFDHLFVDGQTFEIGALKASVLHTPGHTPACVVFLIEGNAFIGDTLFMPDYGTARADFPGGDARMLYRSIHKVLSLPPETRLYMCHDYKAPGRDAYAWQSTVADQRANNVHVKDGITEEAFVDMREKRDATLAVPRLLLPSLQVNIRAGRFPAPQADGARYLLIPVKGQSPEAVL